MSLKDRLTEDMKAAMRQKDAARLEAVRMLINAVKRREIDERVSLDDTQVLAVIEKLIKQGREAIDQFDKGARPDLADKEHAQIAVFQSYLPAQLSAAEVEALIGAAISAAGATTIKDMGKVVASLKPKLQGRADMGKVSAQVKARLGG